LADVILDSGTIRAFNGAGYLMVGANTYTGVGDLGRVSTIREDINRFPRGVTIQLASVTSSSLLSEAIGETMFNRQVTLYRCWYNPSSLSIVNTPERWFKGNINEVNVNRGDPEMGDYIELTVFTRLKREAYASYYTQQDMMVGPYSGDTFFSFTDQIPNFKALWGQEPTYFDNLPGPAQPSPNPRRFPWLNT
jgi:hypothetical protein